VDALRERSAGKAPALVRTPGVEREELPADAAQHDLPIEIDPSRVSFRERVRAVDHVGSAPEEVEETHRPDASIRAQR